MCRGKLLNRNEFLTQKLLPFATCTFPIMHLICLPKFCITFVFHFSWVLQPSREKLKTIFLQNFWEQIRCIMGNVEVTYCRHASIVLKYLNSYIYCRQLLFLFLLLSLVLDQQSLKVGTQSAMNMEFTCAHTVAK